VNHRDAPAAFAAFDHLATMVAIVAVDGTCVFANSSCENVLGLSRRRVQRASVFSSLGLLVDVRTPQHSG